MHKKSIERGLDLIVKGSIDLLSLNNSCVDELCVSGQLGGCENEGGIGRGILRLVLCNSGKVTGVTDDGLQNVSGGSDALMVEGGMEGRENDGGVN